jgi:hypothetical protein
VRMYTYIRMNNVLIELFLERFLDEFFLLLIVHKKKFF